MNILILYCHPEPTSFNHSLKEVAVKTLEEQGHVVEVSDLYGEKFDPVESAKHYQNRLIHDRFDPLSEQRNAYKTDSLADDVKREIDRVKRCDLLILQFPLWWHQQPAMIKGWFDRVFVGGGLYTSSMRYDRGYFKGQRAICSVTSGAPLNTFTRQGRGGGDIDTLLHPLHYSLHYMGFTVLPAYLTTEVQGAGFTYKDENQLLDDLNQHKSRLERHLKKIENLTGLSFPGWDDWDASGVEKNN
jgi:NAD(P)H dehydrogenase (quinone)